MNIKNILTNDSCSCHIKCYYYNYYYRKMYILDMKKKLDFLRSHSMIIGMTNGCFDLFHVGHAYFLKECLNNCDFLFVLCNTDISIKKIKGNDRPIYSCNDRFNILSYFLRNRGCPLLFCEEAFLESFIQFVSPDVLFKGEEYVDKSITGSKYAGRVYYVKILDNKRTTLYLNTLQRNKFSI